MAHAANSTGLAHQAGTSQPWKTALATIAVVAIVLALVIAVMFIGSRALAPATGRDDGVIEAQRDATLLSGGATSKVFVGGTSANGTEGAAAAAARAGVPAVPAVVDESYYTTGGVRDLAPVPATKLDATSVDRKYQEIQSQRTHHGAR